MRAAGLLLPLGLLLACSTVTPRAPAPAQAEGAFLHDDLDRFLSRHVDDRGRVDYAAAVDDRADLDRYLAALAAASPDSHPERFADEDARLAYWLNAYNASVIAIVLEHYPISGVKQVRAPIPLRYLLPRVAGFFLFQRARLGGRAVSLYGLENRVVRRRFSDPRIHFALNCASIGCPRLPAGAFTGPRLPEQLERETRRFVAEERNLRLDAESRTLWLSSIFRWYESDFTSWLERRQAGQGSGLRDYVLLYLDPERAAPIRACADCRVAFLDYDWGLNVRRDAAG